MKKVKLELFMIFESDTKEYIDYYVFIRIRLLSILKLILILENYGYRIDLALINDE